MYGMYAHNVCTCACLYVCILHFMHFWYIIILQWLKHDFLSYLDDWEASSQAQEGLSQTEKNKLCISRETLEGLRIIGGTHSLLHAYYTTIMH
jgi:hypothetical protein